MREDNKNEFVRRLQFCLPTSNNILLPTLILNILHGSGQGVRPVVIECTSESNAVGLAAALPR